MLAAIDPTQRFRLIPVQVRYAVTLSRLGGDDRFSPFDLGLIAAEKPEEEFVVNVTALDAYGPVRQLSVEV